jgi:hypothetical protein
MSDGPLKGEMQLRHAVSTTTAQVRRSYDDMGHSLRDVAHVTKASSVN